MNNPYRREDNPHGFANALITILIVGALVGILIGVTLPTGAVAGPRKAETSVPPPKPEPKTVCEEYPEENEIARLLTWTTTIHHGLMTIGSLKSDQIACALDLDRLKQLDALVVESCEDDPKRDFGDTVFVLLSQHLDPCDITIRRE